YIPGKTSISVTKSWNDSNNQDGIRPNSVVVKLFADGTDAKQSVTLNEGNKWTASFTDLAEYKNGTKIVYTVKEEAVTDYTSTTTGDTTTGFIITNTHTPEKISVTGSKTWDDSNNQDGKRPTSITINLLADGVQVDAKTITEADGWSWSFTNLAKYKAGTVINYTVTEATVKDYQTKVTGYNITNTYIPGKTSISVTKSWNDSNNHDGIRPNSVSIKLFADGTATKQSVTLNEGNKWTASFTDLPEFQNGTKIVYTVKEEAVTGYTSTTTGDTTTGFIITNTHTPEKISVTGSKTWDDSNNQDGKRPTSITIHLLNNGKNVGSKTVTEAEGWKWEFTDLPKKEAGKDIVYTIIEEAVPEYQTTVKGYDITNSYTPGKTSINVVKSWEDNDNQDGIRSNKVTVKLFANGNDTKKTVELNAKNNWRASFTDLDEYKDKLKIVYTLEEVQVDGYKSTIVNTDSNNVIITNTHDVETVGIKGSKQWDDKEDQDGKRPASITINLLANGKMVDSKVVSKEDNWKWNFTNLPKNEFGKAISYTVTEEAVPGYQTIIDGYNITNSYTPGKISINVVKSWKDNNNKDKIRPDSVTVKLLADGKDTKQEVKLTLKNNWTASFTDLAEYKNGTKIVYTLIETDVKGYNATITEDGKGNFIITNIHNSSKPIVPITPNDPNKPNTPSTIDGNNNTPNTGDTTNSVLMIILFTISGFGIATGLNSRKKKHTN
ncbi:MAG: Cna B-type domain-containing protein, partial [Longicatena sp.]